MLTRIRRKRPEPNTVDVTFDCASTNRSHDLESLREWLPKADPGLRLDFRESDGRDQDHLGVPLDSLFAAISATADLVALGAAVRGWVHNRFGRDTATEPPVIRTTDAVTTIEVGPVTITITGTPSGTPAPPTDPDDG